MSKNIAAYPHLLLPRLKIFQCQRWLVISQTGHSNESEKSVNNEFFIVGFFQADHLLQMMRIHLLVHYVNASSTKDLFLGLRKLMAIRDVVIQLKLESP